MTEAHAQQLVAALITREQVGFERLDPRVDTERIGLAAGDQVRVKHFVIRRVLALHHVVDHKLGGYRLLGEQALEHLPIALVLIDQSGTQNIGFQDADA